MVNQNVFFTDKEDEDLFLCEQCTRLFPIELFAGPICPLCALENRNRTHGLPLDTPFHGDTANYMWEQATDFLKEKNDAR